MSFTGALEKVRRSFDMRCFAPWKHTYNDAQGVGRHQQLELGAFGKELKGAAFHLDGASKVQKNF